MASGADQPRGGKALQRRVLGALHQEVNDRPTPLQAGELLSGLLRLGAGPVLASPRLAVGLSDSREPFPPAKPGLLL